MAVIKLGDLTTFEGDTSGSWLVINDPTNTATFKAQKEQLLSGSFAGTASFADNAATASYVDAANVVGLNLSQIASGSATASITPGLFNVNTNTNVQGNLTASNILTTGNITAQTLVVQTVSSSIIYSSGSNTFGDELTDRQQFTGSVSITGSLSMLQGVANLTASYALTSSINQINESQYRFELVTTIDQDLWLFPATITRVVKSPGVDTAQYRTGSAEAFNTITFTGNESTTPIAVKVNDEFSWRITYNSGYTTAALTVVSQRN